MPYRVIQVEYAPGAPGIEARRTPLDPPYPDQAGAVRAAANENNARKRRGRREWARVSFTWEETTA